MGQIRNRIFQSWFRFRRPMTLGARAIVEDSAGRVLLVRHTYTEGLFLPGGGVEHGETVLQAITRELEEEGGVRLTGTPPIMGFYSNHRHFANDHVALFHVRAGLWQACPQTSRGEIAEIVWIDPLQPPGDITPGNGRRLKEAYGGAPIDPHW
ncbi:MAG: NUDIX domain-containing protein [Pseudomonadota bacterium]